MSHYYENDPTLRSKRKTLDLYLNDKKLSFVSDSGVFSNSQIDYGSFTFLKTLLKENKVETLLDVGCGYGILGITLCYFGFTKKATLIDINEKAISLTKENIDNYHLDNVECFVSNGFEKITSKYAAIVINPPIRAGKEVINKMFADSVKHLTQNGSLYIVIKKSLGAPSAIKYLQTLYANVLILNKDKGYYIIKSYN